MDSLTVNIPTPILWKHLIMGLNLISRWLQHFDLTLLLSFFNDTTKHYISLKHDKMNRHIQNLISKPCSYICYNNINRHIQNLNHSCIFIPLAKLFFPSYVITILIYRAMLQFFNMALYRKPP